MKRTLLRSTSIALDTLTKGLMLPIGARTVAIQPSGQIGKIDVIYEQEFEFTETTKETP